MSVSSGKCYGMDKKFSSFAHLYLINDALSFNFFVLYLMLTLNSIANRWFRPKMFKDELNYEDDSEDGPTDR